MDIQLSTSCSFNRIFLSRTSIVEFAFNKSAKVYSAAWHFAKSLDPEQKDIKWKTEGEKARRELLGIKPPKLKGVREMLSFSNMLGKTATVEIQVEQAGMDGSLPKLLEMLEPETQGTSWPTTCRMIPMLRSFL